jgi:hypothetical protein
VLFELISTHVFFMAYLHEDVISAKLANTFRIDDLLTLQKLVTAASLEQ